MAAARELNIRWDEVMDVPEHVVRAAWQNVQARESARIKLSAKFGGFE